MQHRDARVPESGTGTGCLQPSIDEAAGLVLVPMPWTDPRSGAVATADERCRDCGELLGHHRHLECCVEICSRCGEALTGCTCPDAAEEAAPAEADAVAMPVLTVEVLDRDRHRGCLLGLAVGDALGTTLEFRTPGTFEPIDDMVGGGPFGLKAGQWTDDTSMALCLAESLLAKDFDPADQVRRYVRWYREGYFSSTGRCFDIGNTVRDALHQFEQTGLGLGGSRDPRTAGNGSLMRLAPVPMAFAADPAAAIRACADASRTTHGALEAVDACRYLGALIVGALRGATKDELMSSRYTPVPGLWDEEPLAPKIEAIAGGSFRDREPPDIRGSGYVVESLEAALWAFHRARDFREGALLAVNLGDDADTTGAVYGQLAGAFWGETAIPAEWRERLAMRDRIEGFANGLYERATRIE